MFILRKKVLLKQLRLEQHVCVNSIRNWSLMSWLIRHFSFTHNLWRNNQRLWLFLDPCLIANSTAIIVIQNSERTNCCRLRKPSHELGSQLLFLNFFLYNLILQSINIHRLSRHPQILCSFLKALASTRVLRSCFNLWVRRCVLWFLSENLEFSLRRNFILSLLLEHIVTVSSLMFWSFYDCLIGIHILSLLDILLFQVRRRRKILVLRRCVIYIRRRSRNNSFCICFSFSVLLMLEIVVLRPFLVQIWVLAQFLFSLLYDEINRGHLFLSRNNDLRESINSFSVPNSLQLPCRACGRHVNSRTRILTHIVHLILFVNVRVLVFAQFYLFNVKKVSNSKRYFGCRHRFCLFRCSDSSVFLTLIGLLL